MDHDFEWGLTIFALVFAVFALYLGWKTHRTPYILTLLVVGITGLFIARGLEGEHSHSKEETAQVLVHNQHHENPIEIHAEKHSDKDGLVHAHNQEHKEQESVHHDDQETKTRASAVHHNDHDDHHDDHHEGGSHLLAEILAIFSSICLLIGHLLNLIGIRRTRHLTPTHVCILTL